MVLLGLTSGIPEDGVQRQLEVHCLYQPGGFGFLIWVDRWDRGLGASLKASGVMGWGGGETEGSMRGANLEVWDETGSSMERPTEQQW